MDRPRPGPEDLCVPGLTFAAAAMFSLLYRAPTWFIAITLAWSGVFQAVLLVDCLVWRRGQYDAVRRSLGGDPDARAMCHERITITPEQMGGVPCIRGLRIPVATVCRMVRDGMSTGEILAAHPGLHADDVVAALRYAINWTA
jgi:uncharacterized protein (DUF433 family)